MANEEAAKQRPRAKRIDKRRNYVFGPVPRGYEYESDTEMVSFSTRAENGINYPREYPGSYFTDALAVNTFEEYLSRNPENLKPGARFFFYEKNEDGTTSLVTSGTMMPPHAHESPQRLSDQTPAGASPHPIIINTPQASATSERHNRAAMEDLIEQMRAEIDSLREQVATKDRRIDEMQRSVIDAEQKRLAAEAQLTVATDRHRLEMEAQRERHAADIETMKQLHEKDVEIIARNASDEANKTLNERLSDMEGKETTVDRAMEMLSDFSPILTPIVNKLGEVGGMLMEDWIEQVRERRARRKGLPLPSQRGLPAPSESHAQQPSNDPQQHTHPATPPRQNSDAAVDAASIFGR